MYCILCECPTHRNPNARYCFDCLETHNARQRKAHQEKHKLAQLAGTVKHRPRRRCSHDTLITKRCSMCQYEQPLLLLSRI